MNSTNIACAIFAFDRPEYLESTLESIYTSWKESGHKIDFYFFQDGNYIMENGVPTEVGSSENKKQTTNVLRNYAGLFDKAKIHVSTVNVGIAKMKSTAHSLFDQYNKIIFFEDDMIVSPYYISLLLAMSEQFPDCVVQAGDRTIDVPPKDNFENHLNEVIYSGCHWWGYLMPSFMYEKIQPILNIYNNIVGNNYRKRPNETIKKAFNVPATSHDAILQKIMTDNDFGKIATYVPRAKYIGRQGLHATPYWYKEFGFDIQKPYIFSKDKNIKQFKLRSN